MLGKENEGSKVPLDVIGIHADFRCDSTVAMHDAAKRVEPSIIQKISKVVRDKILCIKVVGGLNVAQEVVIDELALLVGRASSGDDVVEILDGFESGRHCDS